MSSGPRLELDSVLRCDHCADAPFRVFRRQLVNFPGTEREQVLQGWESVLWPAHPDVPPPVRTEAIGCPACGGPLRRVAP